MENSEIETFNRLSSDVLSRLGLPEDIPGESRDDYKIRLARLHVGVAFPNLDDADKSIILSVFLIALNTTTGINLLTLPLVEGDRAEWERIVREAEHDQLPFFRKAIEERGVRCKLTAFQCAFLDYLMRIEFFSDTADETTDDSTDE